MRPFHSLECGRGNSKRKIDHIRQRGAHARGAKGPLARLRKPQHKTVLAARRGVYKGEGEGKEGEGGLVIYWSHSTVCTGSINNSAPRGWIRGTGKSKGGGGARSKCLVNEIP